MADAVTSQLLENGPRNVCYKFTNFSDGTGESAVVKVNATSAGGLGVVMQGQTFYPGTHLALVDMEYDIREGAVRILWDADTDQDIWIASGAGAGPFKWKDTRGGFGGVTAPTTLTGATGSILFTTVDFANKSSYSIVMWLTKNVPQT